LIFRKTIGIVEIKASAILFKCYNLKEVLL
jgi:hypothetical protein